MTFRYEWHDDSGQWYRSYGNELWEFADSGLMQRRIASINDKPISEVEREFNSANFIDEKPIGDYAELSEMLSRVDFALDITQNCLAVRESRDAGCQFASAH